MEEIFLNIFRGIYHKYMANIIFNKEELKAFPLKYGRYQGYPLLSLLFNIVLESIAIAIKKTIRKEYQIYS